MTGDRGTLITVLLAVVATGAVIGWLNSCSDFQDARDQAEVLADTAAAREARADSAESQVRLIRDSLRAERRALDSLRTLATEQADSLRRIGDQQSELAAEYGEAWEEAVTVARSEIPEPYLPAVDTLVARAERRDQARSQALAARTAEAAEMREALGLAEETIQNLERETTVQDSLHRVAMQGLRGALEAAREEAALWEREANPGFFGDLDKYLEGAAAGGALACAFLC